MRQRRKAKLTGTDKVLVITNLDVGDNTFTNDIGTWNVSRAWRDCLAGKHKVWSLDVAQAAKANEKVEVEEAKVKRFMADERILEIPLIGIIEGGITWMIEGHHRLRALQRLGIKDCAAYIIEEKDGAPYDVRYNGKRKLEDA